MRRLIWIGVGVGITIIVIRRGRRTAEKLLPANVIDQGQQLVGRAVSEVQSFAADARAAMSQREAEIRDALDLQD